MKGKRWRALLALSFCCLLPWGALGQQAVEPLEVAQSLEGMWTYPQGVSPEEAGYVLRYAYPQFVAATEADQAINAYYQAVCQDLQNLLLPQNAEEILSLREPGDPPYTADLSWQVTSNTGQYLSVILSNKQFFGRTETESLQANVFARDGMYAGQMVSLSQVIGLEQEGGEFDARSSYASQLVYKLVWEIICQQSASRQIDFLEGLTQERLQAQFSPETDFYLDEEENLVFFLQSGTIASEVEGYLTYPFSVAELLSAARE